MSSSNSFDEVGNGLFTFRDLTALIARWKKQLLLVGVIAVVVSSVVSFILTPKYKSTVVFYPTTNNSISNALLTDLNQRQKDPLEFGAVEEAEKALQILQSSKLTERLVRNYQLMAHYKIDPNSSLKKAKLADKISANFSFSRTRYLSIKVDVLDEDPVMAAKMANGILDLYDSIKNEIQYSRKSGDTSLIMGFHQGQFYFTPDYSMYPFDEQVLDIIVENSLFPSSELIFISDTSSYSRIKASILINRSFLPYISKLIIPLIIILILVYFVFFLPAEKLDIAAGLTVTSLLSAIAFQTAMSTDIPEIGYIIYIDKVFYTCYFLIALSTAQSLITYYLDFSGEEKKVKLASQLDYIFRFLFPLLFFAAVILFAL